MGKLFFAAVGGLILFVFGFMLSHAFVLFAAGDVSTPPAWVSALGWFLGALLSGSFVVFIYKR